METTEKDSPRSIPIRPHIGISLAFLCGLELALALVSIHLPFTIELAKWYVGLLITHAVIAGIAAVVKACALVITEYRMIEIIQTAQLIEWVLVMVVPAIVYGFIDSISNNIILITVYHGAVSIGLWLISRYKT